MSGGHSSSWEPWKALVTCPSRWPMCLHVKSPWRAESYFSQSTFVLRRSPAQRTIWEMVEKKRCRFRKRLEVWSGAFTHCQFVTVSGATREPHPARREGFDTRRSRYFRFLSSQRRRHHVRKRHEQRDKREDTVGVNDAFFITQSGRPAV